MGTVYRLCELLDSMLDMAPLRQNALIVLAVSAELIPRLWYGALKVCVQCCISRTTSVLDLLLTCAWQTRDSYLEF